MPKDVHQYKLQLRNASEDIPRMLLGGGKACGGEFTLVVRADAPRVALVHRVGREYRLYASDVANGPKLPTAVVDRDTAAAAIAAAKQGLAKLAEPARRGAWAGVLICEDAPIVMLTRKIASYATIRVVSEPGSGAWRWTVEREKRWHAAQASDAGKAPNLAAAIRAAYGAADGIVAAACTVQATHRRAAHDPAYAAEHPNRPSKEGKDPTERLTHSARGQGSRPAAGASTAVAPPAPPPAPKPSTRRASPATTGASKPAKPAKRGKAAPGGQEDVDGQLLGLFSDAFERFAAS